MKTLVKTLFLGGACLIGWWVGGQLTSDALGLLLGVMLGSMAGIPLALMIVAASKQKQSTEQGAIGISGSNLDAALPPPRRPAAIVVRPTRYIVVEAPQQQLQDTQRNRIEAQQ